MFLFNQNIPEFFRINIELIIVNKISSLEEIYIKLINNG